MGKSSSSHRKKRSKDQSQARIKKRSKSRSKAYNKSKKLCRRDDSLSYSDDDDDSRKSVSISSSSSEDDYRSRRARSRARKDVKGSKKRARRRSYSRESSEEPPRVRKRNGLKRDNGSDVGRKSHKKKKPRREASVSSRSSRSLSCSTCKGGSISSDEGEFERRRGRAERKEKDERKMEKVRSGTKRTRYRSRSCSSCSQHSEINYYWNEEKKTGEGNLRRLRSVITVVEEEKEGRVSNKDEYKEEIIYDNDDYPSSRSNDSNDGGSKRELDHHSTVASEHKMRVYNDKGEEPFVSNLKTNELRESDKDVEGRYDGSNPSSSRLGTNDFIKGKLTEVSGATSNQNGGDLETILRQKALENLRRFRGGVQANANSPANKNDKTGGDLKQPSTAKAESIKIKSKEDFTKMVGPKSSKEDSHKFVSATHVVKRISVPTVRNFSLGNDEKIPDGKNNGHESGSAKHEFACAPGQVAIAGNPNEKVSAAVGSVTNKPKLATPALRRHSLEAQSTMKQLHTSQEPHQANLLVTGSTLVESAPDQVDIAGNPNEKVGAAVGSVTNKPKLVTPALRGLSLKTQSTMKQVPTPQEPHQPNLSVTESPLVESAPDQVAIAANPNEKVGNAVGSVTNKPELATPALRRRSFKTQSTTKQVVPSQESHQANFLVTESTLVESAAETAQTVSPTSNINDEDDKKACGTAALEPSSCLKSSLAEDSSSKPQDEAPEGSQFEKKTMTVMRGGEMVQVSYKVYIPKKAPALARRQLKR